MKKIVAAWLIAGLGAMFSATLETHTMPTARADIAAAEPQLAHMVFFTLKDKSPESKQNLVAACKKYLSKHSGTVYFSAGTRCEDLDRPVNDREFDVALHVVFKTKADHDRYQDAPLHLQFIEENKDNWTKVRVFDSNVEP
jgi:hypothetical protein